MRFRRPRRQGVVFPWSIGETDLHEDVLELGSGSGAMAVQLLDRYFEIGLTAADVDPAMRAAATRRLDSYGGRAVVLPADATDLPFDDSTFDAVVSFIMLHHVIDWEQALAEIARVLRPGGALVGYDLVESTASRLTHRLDRSPHRMAPLEDLRRQLNALPYEAVDVTPGLGGIVTRFRALRSPKPDARPVGGNC